ncbi:MAG: DNA polymerase III subunit delta [Bacteroidota bacterium]|nr:DNA polymerase III subunit delta [Bacteroidota bacterium]
MMLEHWEDCFRKGLLPPVVLLFGEERFLLEEAYSMLRQRLEHCDPVGVNLEVVDAESISPRELVERAQVYPAFAELRGLFVRRAERLLGRGNGAGAVLTDYLRKPQPTTVLVFLAESAPESLRGVSRYLRNPKYQAKVQQMLQRVPSLWRLLLKEHAWVEFPKLYEREIPSWVVQRAARYGYTLSPPALEALLTTAGTDLAELDNELQKLAVLAQSSGLSTVDEDLVLHVAGFSRSYSIFELQKALSEGDVEKALRVAQYLVSSQGQELMVLSMLTRYFFMLWKLADLEQVRGVTEEAIATALGVHPFFVSEYRAAYRRFGPSAIEQALFALQRAEVALKSGAKPPESVISELILAITGKLEQKGSEYAI